jgi:hypothetical protein
VCQHFCLMLAALQKHHQFFSATHYHQ